jgi:hypothetical protein
MFIAKEFRDILRCENVHFWIIDTNSATFYTVNEKGEKVTAFINEGLFGEII